MVISKVLKRLVDELDTYLRLYKLKMDKGDKLS
jgi:hypothetical protein